MMTARSSGSGPGSSAAGSASAPRAHAAALEQGQGLFDQPRAVLVQVLVGQVVQVADELQRRVVHALELLAVLGLDEDALDLGVAQDMAGVGLGKTGQDGDGHGAHGGDGQVGDDPVGAVLAHDGHAVALLDAARGQGRRHLLELLLQLQVDDGLLAGEGDRRLAAVLIERPLQKAADGQFFEFNDHGGLLDRANSKEWGKECQIRARDEPT